MGAFRKGYASDMTRMAHVGPPTPKYKRAYRAVLEAQLAAIDRVKAGATTQSVDRAARQTLKQYGLERSLFIPPATVSASKSTNRPNRKKDHTNWKQVWR